MICSKGLRKSFWKRKLANSPFSMNFMESCRRESTAKKAISSLGLHPTYKKRKLPVKIKIFTLYCTKHYILFTTPNLIKLITYTVWNKKYDCITNS